jgi:hypothetical protein
MEASAPLCAGSPHAIAKGQQTSISDARCPPGTDRAAFAHRPPNAALQHDTMIASTADNLVFEGTQTVRTGTDLPSESPTAEDLRGPARPGRWASGAAVTHVHTERHPRWMPIWKWHSMRMVDRDLDDLAGFLLARAIDPGIDTLDWTAAIGIVVAAYRECLAIVQTERAMRSPPCRSPITRTTAQNGHSDAQSQTVDSEPLSSDNVGSPRRILRWGERECRAT